MTTNSVSSETKLHTNEEAIDPRFPAAAKYKDAAGNEEEILEDDAEDDEYEENEDDGEDEDET